MSASDIENQEQTLQRRSSSVVWGFTGLLLLMGALVADSYLQWRGMSNASTALRREYAQRDILLDELRSNIYRSNNLMREFLLEPDSKLAETHKSDLLLLRERCNTIGAEYERLLLAAEKPGARDLDKDMEEYWRYLDPAMEWPAAVRRARGEAYVLESVTPHRKLLVNLLNNVTKINQHDVDAGEARIEELNTRFQRRVATISIIAFLLATALAVFVVLHVRRLEDDGNRRLNELRAARLDLRNLSDRLVTAQEEERRGISRELHDDIGQSMSAMIMEVAQLESRLGPAAHLQQTFSSIRNLAESSIGKIRDLSLALRPAMLDEIGLVPALRWQAKEVARRTGIKVTLLADESDEDLPDDYKTCVYRVVQEALHNCVKHSRATQIRVVLERHPESLFLSVQDNGVGFDPKRNQGLGLLGISERVQKLGGRFHIDSAPGDGSIASIHLQLHPVVETPLQEGVV